MPRAARPSHRLPMSDSSIPADAVLDAIDGGVLLLDANRRIARWNRWLEIASGKAASGVLGKTLEQVFGDIGDEHDVKRPEISNEMVLELEGSTTIRDLETRYNIILPADAGFETLAGFLLTHFGYIPKAGMSMEHGGRRFTILEMDRNRIAKVRIRRLEPAPAADVVTP